MRVQTWHRRRAGCRIEGGLDVYARVYVCVRAHRCVWHPFGTALADISEKCSACRSNVTLTDLPPSLVLPPFQPSLLLPPFPPSLLLPIPPFQPSLLFNLTHSLPDLTGDGAAGFAALGNPVAALNEEELLVDAKGKGLVTLGALELDVLLAQQTCIWQRAHARKRRHRSHECSHFEAYHVL